MHNYIVYKYNTVISCARLCSISVIVDHNYLAVCRVKQSQWSGVTRLWMKGLIELRSLVWVSDLCSLQCFNTVGWVTERVLILQGI